MMQNLYKDLEILLKDKSEFVVNNKLNKSKISDAAYQYDEALLKILLSNKSLKKQFFMEVGGATVFKQKDFLNFLKNKDFLPNSFTEFKNQIGLQDEKGEYFRENKDTVLVFPYKDCVLEGGQEKEDQKRNEIFYNETLAPDEISRLFDIKALTNFKLYDDKGEHALKAKTNIDFSKQNLILKGNNLLALHSLKNIKSIAGQVNLIYIDPPYNPDSKSNTFCYNNKFNESSWLTFMKNRLEVSKTLLSKDGVLIIAIDENEQAALGLLLRELFPSHEIHCITIVHNPRGVQGTNFSYTHEYAFFVIPKGKKSVNDKKISKEEIEWSPLRNWGTESLREDAKNCFYPILINPNTSEVIDFGEVCDDKFHPKSINIKSKKLIKVYPIDNNGIERKWRYARQSIEGIKHLLRARKKNDHWDIELGKDFEQYKTVWIDPKYDANVYGTQIVKGLVPNCKFDFPKSLWNVYDCLYAIVGKDKNALILDFFSGSGTTAHAVIELNKQDNGNRRFILCEQMHYVETVTCKRVQKVMENEKNGSFIFTELKRYNQQYIDDIEVAKDTKTLKKLYEKMKEEAFFRIEIDHSKWDNSAFNKLTLKEQKNLLIDCLDKNHLYVNLTEMEDAFYNMGKNEIALNKRFYNIS
jgi:adenine-specific DNA-methyltransferase